MTTCWDVYDKVRIIVERLDRLGYEEWRGRVDNSLQGTTSSEVLCNVANELEELIRAKLGLPDEDQRLVQEIIREADGLVNR